MKNSIETAIQHYEKRLANGGLSFSRRIELKGFIAILKMIARSEE